MVRAVFAVLVLAASGCWHASPLVEDASGDSDADGDTDSDTDNDACFASGNWYDPATELCWQNPPSGDEVTWQEAIDYCDALELGGYSDWRLPMIQELISLIRGCVSGTETGDLSTSECGVTDPDCLGFECWDACDYCDSLTGPDDDPDGCYWVLELEGLCDLYWSSSSSVYDVDYPWLVYFNNGNVVIVAMINAYYARCVRGGP